MKVRKPKNAKVPRLHNSVPFSEAVVSQKEEVEDKTEAEKFKTVVEEIAVEEPVVEYVIETYEETTKEDIQEETEAPVEVTTPKRVRRARVVVKCASYKMRGRTYRLGQTFEVEGIENIQQYSGEFFEVYDLQYQ